MPRSGAPANREAVIDSNVKPTSIIDAVVAVTAGVIVLLGTAVVFVRGVVDASDTLNLDGQTLGNVSVGYGALLVLVFGVAAAVSIAWRPL